MVRVFRDVSSVRWAWIRLAFFVLFVALAAVVGLLLVPTDLNEIREWVEGLGPGAQVVFVLGYAALTLTPAPKNVLTIAAGLVWGFWPALGMVYVGALLGAAASFVIGRWAGREAVERLTGARVARLDAALANRGFLAVLGARLVPIIPFTLINYGAGLTAVRPRDYAVGTALGIIPGSVAYVALGAFGVEFGPPFWIALSVLGVLALAGVITGVIVRRRGHRAAGSSSDAASVEADDA
ncbi:TVP38/TMEM64 family protein [Microbacterium sp. P03]|uniref:TVP38/TMEM64 family protein n=1 Tax=Microbacterium sp. P03 TaxID=3366946 RepID=UPI003746C598